ncbi:MAG: hypothetical protein DMF24_04795 [Verrucomicrobia bacterium]|nr:MAG: hypothetical protein DMF24_04795 [Verrucomicrobiota bacterium]
MKLQINVPVSGLDLANLLQGEEGFFLCQNRGQNFIAVAKAGHSIAFGPTPIGRGVIEQQIKCARAKSARNLRSEQRPVGDPLQKQSLSEETH